MTLTPEQCLTVLHRGANELRRGNLDAAGQLFSAVIEAAKQLPKEQSYAVLPIATANLSLLATRRGKPENAAQLRALTLTTLDGITSPPLHPGFLQLIGDALFDLGEHRRAAVYYELCAQLVSDNGDALNTAVLLSRTGQSYCRAGLPDHGVIPLRAAVRILRNYLADPRMPDALLNLGNALRKKRPVEAETAYKEAAEWYESRLQLEAAAPAWVNLGILCSETGRHQEALRYYGKAFEIRQRSPGTPPIRIASVLNNVSNCYRRLEKFAEAHSHIDRAIQLLESISPTDIPASRLLASAYHSRALIFAAEARDPEALHWFQKADVTRQSQPNPSLEDTAVDLTELIAVLDRLGRTVDGDAARKRLVEIRAVQQASHASDLDLSGLSGDGDGALQIEIGHASSRSREQANLLSDLGRRLDQEAKLSGAGRYSGSVTIPEATTLLFYGPDAEALFRALEPALRSEPLSRSARVAIRQGQTLRELSLSAN